MRWNAITLLVSSIFCSEAEREHGEIIWVLQCDDDDDETRTNTSTRSSSCAIPYKGFNFMFTRPNVPND